MKTGRPKKLKLVVTQEQEKELRVLARQSKERRVAFRSRIVLKCFSGMNNLAVARELRTTGFTVGFWRKRFIRGGIEALLDEPRPGTPRKIGDDRVVSVVETTLESIPKGATHWSSRMMAKKMGLSPSTILRMWRAFGLKPHRAETFQLSTDPYFVEKVRDIVGLYMSPPTNALVLCVDEKSQIQALNRTQPILPMRPGQVERHTPEYKRNGTTSLFAALEVATGNVIGKCFRRHRSREFKKFLDHLDAQMPMDLEIHLIMDNYATHKTAEVKRWLQRHPHYHLHFTPTHSSWLNQIERWFALLSQRQIKRGSHHNTRELEQAIRKFIAVHNQDAKAFVWTKSADQILASLKRFATQTLVAHAQ